MQLDTRWACSLLGAFALLGGLVACETSTSGSESEAEGGEEDEGEEGEEGEEDEGEEDEGEEGEGEEGEGEEGEGEEDEGEEGEGEEGEGEGHEDCAPEVPYDVAALRADVEYLASAELDGRKPGTPGDAAARSRIAERFACLGLASFDGLTRYEQPFTNDAGQATANLLARLPGQDPEVAAEVILVNAHHDHLGDGHLGANDNASGVAALLAMAATLARSADSLPRTVVLAAFGSEEPGFEGAQYFVDHPPAGFDPASIVYELNLDMVGNYDAAGALDLLGSFPATPGRTLAEQALPRYRGLNVRLGEGSNEAENVPFCSRGIPYLFAWTEDAECYHEPCDTVDRVDFPHLATIAELMGDLAAGLAATELKLTEAIRAGQDVCLAAGQ